MPRSKLLARTLFVTCLVMVGGTVAVLLTLSDTMRRERQDQIFQGLDGNVQNILSTLRLLGSEPRLVGEALFIGDTNITNSNALVDGMQRAMAVDVTFFALDRAVATTLRDSRGLRRVGYRLPVGPVRAAVLLQGDAYREAEEIDGQLYYSSYLPILDRSQVAIGAVEVSLKASVAMARDNQFRIAIMVLACGSLLGISLMYWLHSRSLGNKIAARETDLGVSKRHLNTAFEKMPNGLCLFDGNHVLVRASDHYVHLLGLPEGALKPGMDLKAVIARLLGSEPGGAQRVEDIHRKVLRHLNSSLGPTTLEYPWKGRTLAVHHSFMGNGGWLLSYEDVTERNEARAHIEYLATHDPVTGLENRVVLQEKIEAAVNAPYPSVLMMLDLDHFKTVNDTLGHATGDALLKALAQRMREALPRHATVARLGGDEFAVIQNHVGTVEDATALAEKLVKLAAEPFEIDGSTLHIGTSIGIAFPQAGQSSESLMRQVDLALYSAKDKGRGGFSIYQPAMEERLMTRKALEEDLRHAVANDEFEMFYQPLINLASGRILGFEALMRWRHPKRGLVPPDQFIPVAEETGLIIPMGAWAMRRSCLDAAAWPKLKVAVNLSPVQFRDGHLAQIVERALADSGLAPNLLEIEITETAMVGDKAGVTAMLRRLRALGVQIAMDDFGTGYSSLSYFREFQFDKVKIDRSFVDGIGERPDSDAIINAVLGIARDLKMVVLAEGIETKVQLDRLRARGCHEGQGYLFSRPVPLEHVPGLFKQINAAAKEAAAQAAQAAQGHQSSPWSGSRAKAT